MAKFCGNCGYQSDDGAKICGNCGSPLDTENAAASSIPGIGNTNPEQQAKTKSAVGLFAGIAVVVAVVIIAVNIISGFFGYKGVVRKIMKAYEDYDISAIESVASDVYDDDYAEDYFESIISYNLDIFEDRLGSKYKLSYKITDSYKLSERKLDDLFEELSYFNDFDEDLISEAMTVKIEVSAKSGKKDVNERITLTLTKEDGDWKLLRMSN